MSLPVSLSDFVNELDVVGDEWHVYLNRRTGEFFTVSLDDSAAEDVGDEDRHLIAEVLGSADWLPLPSRQDLNEFRIMRDFCAMFAGDSVRADLGSTIGGRGTFGRFKNMVHRHDLQEGWYRFRVAALKRIAVNWLEAHSISHAE